MSDDDERQERLAGIRSRHWRVADAGFQECAEFGEAWPCDAVVLLAEVARERQAFADLTRASAERIDALTARIDRAEHALLDILREAAWEPRLIEWRKHAVTAVGTQPTPHEACREIREIARRALHDIGAEAEQ